MAGRTTGYEIDPRGEYVFGVVGERPMRSRRRRERRVVGPGQLVAWDPSAPHRGAAIDGRPWFARLMILEVADLGEIAGDAEVPSLGEVCFPEPVVDDRALGRGFRELHAALAGPATRLERDELLAVWLRTLIERASAPRPRPPAITPDDGRALELACDFLGDHPTRNIGLDELAAAAGIGKFRLIRLFRERTGLPPHALQIAHRLRRARRLLEAGDSIAAVAAATGFADQSHLHRHFRRSLGLTPGAYREHFRV